MNVIISIFGPDSVGILKHISTKIADYNISIVDIRQSLLDKYFTMTMIVDFENSTCSLEHFINRMSLLGKKLNLEIKVMHEDIFKVTHKI